MTLFRNATDLGHWYVCIARGWLNGDVLIVIAHYFASPCGVHLRRAM